MQQARQAVGGKDGLVKRIKLGIDYKIIGGAEVNRSKISLPENSIQQITFVKHRTAHIGLGKGGFF